jgi:hypothetical protein
VEVWQVVSGSRDFGDLAEVSIHSAPVSGDERLFRQKLLLPASLHDGFVSGLSKHRTVQNRKSSIDGEDRTKHFVDSEYAEEYD